MKKTALLLLGFTLLTTHLYSASVLSDIRHACRIDITNSNTEKNLSFVNQVVEEFLTPEQMKSKVRVREFTQGSGNSIDIIDELSKTGNHFDEQVNVYMNREFNEVKHEELLSASRRLSFRTILYEFKERGKGLLKDNINYKDYITYEVVSEKPQDIIYVIEGKSPDSELSMIFIKRAIQIDKWRLVISYEAIGSKMTSEKKENLIQKLKNIATINDWIAKNR
jgi:hypothetical protein